MFILVVVKIFALGYEVTNKKHLESSALFYGLYFNSVKLFEIDDPMVQNFYFLFIKNLH